MQNLRSCALQTTVIGVFLLLIATASGAQQPPALISNGGTLHSFSKAVNLPLKTDADYERFVDPQITGNDRARAIFFLKLMPPGMRGDFVYVNKVGTILSNRLAVAAAVRFLPRPGAVGYPHHPAATRSSSLMAPRVFNVRQPVPDQYPPTSFPGGGGIRNYSAQGVNALYGYATPPCDINLPTGDAGNMYFNAYDQNGNDAVDAGLATISQTSSMGAYINIYGPGYLFNGGTNLAQTWPCGSPIGIMYGTLASPNQGTSMLGAGIPDYDPTQMQLPPSNTTWTSAA